MAKPILPQSPRFLQDDAFGHWLAGFVAAEGTFGMSRQPTAGVFQCLFSISLRADDLPILTEVRDRLGCGTVTLAHKRGDKSPRVAYRVRNADDLSNVVVPFFERYPVRAKKQADFDLWKQAVPICREVKHRKVRHKAAKYGSIPKWSDAERSTALKIARKLWAVREYVDPENPQPLPIDDPESFRSWITGFVDGEGCFRLSECKNIFTCGFKVGVRADDSAVLLSIRSLWGCGSMFRKKEHKGSRPVVVYSLQRISDLEKCVVPHFTSNPLRSRKQKDFPIWREAVMLSCAVQKKPRKVLLLDGGGNGKLLGTSPRWTPQLKRRFRGLQDQLSRVRMFERSPVEGRADNDPQLRLFG